ncbi:HlyD family secretion protein [Microvirga sp. W0021]|uniref:HlyD family secretion protein n=1 Tax=Hohaiivirga grylli TaxID=3133970 RepID=A0ABV0BFE8_9HYPH
MPQTGPETKKTKLPKFIDNLLSPAQKEALRKRIRTILMGGGVALIAIVSLFIWWLGGRYVSIDNAYIGANKLLVSTDVSGIVKEISVKEGQTVKKGDILFQLDPLPFQISLDKANAQLEQTKLAIEAMKQDYSRMQSDIAAQVSQVSLAKAQYDRYNVLVQDNNVSKANYDQARFSLQSAESTLASLQQQARTQLIKLGGSADIAVTDHPQYKQAKSDRDEAQRQFDHTTVRAPFNGTVTHTDSLQPGQYLPANTAAFGLVDDQDVWIDANPKETDLTYVKPGNPVSISVDTYPGKKWHGTVESVSPASGSSFSILPAQNSSGNWVKVVQRIPVRIKVDQRDGDLVLRTGMSVVVEIDTGHHRSLSELF